MKLFAQLVGLGAAVFLPASYTYSYGSLGHEIVGNIATTYLCGQATAEVRQLLEGDSLGRASRWPDWIRKEPRWRKSRPWHFINVPDDARIVDVTGRAGGDVVWAISEFRDELADPNLSQKRHGEALRFLAHFIADVHQPLHVGRHEDRGGNKIAVLSGGRASNLHKIWDATELLKQARQQQSIDVAEQTAAIRVLTDGRVDEWQSAGVLDWARESKALRPKVYAFRVPASGARVVLDEKYRAAALEISRQRLAAAGVRLAGVLNEIYCPRDLVRE